MSNERSEPNYNLRARRSRADPSEGFIRASDLIRRRDEDRGVHNSDTNQQEAESHEVVSHLPPSDNDEGGGTTATQGALTVDTTGDQGAIDSTGEAQGQQHTPPHSPMVEEAATNKQPELLRLRVRVWNRKTHRVTYEYVSVNTMI